MSPRRASRLASSFHALVERTRAAALTPAEYWLTRFILLRLLGLLYLIAFLAAALQLGPLIGHDGLLPADTYLRRLTEHFGSRAEGFFELPSVFWFGVSDGALLT